MSQFHEKTEQILGIQERPSGTRSNPSSRLQNANPGFRQHVNHCIDILDFEEDVMNSLTFLIEERAKSIAISLQQLDELQFQWPNLEDNQTAKGILRLGLRI